MRFDFSKRFRKQYRKLPERLRSRADERLLLFARSPAHPLLHNHELHGAYAGCRSINISGDYRAVYILADPDTALFVAIGTHHDLFGS